MNSFERSVVNQVEYAPTSSNDKSRAGGLVYSAPKYQRVPFPHTNLLLVLLTPSADSKHIPSQFASNARVLISTHERLR